MPTRKIADLSGQCRHPDHNPHSMIVLPDGVYEHVCDGCGKRFVFEVSKPAHHAAWTAEIDRRRSHSGQWVAAADAVARARQAATRKRS